MNLTLLGLLAGCGQPTPNLQPATPAPVPTPVRPDTPLPGPEVGSEHVGEAPLPGATSGVREARRMDVEQLDASIRVATGGIGWDINGVSQFAELASSLGVPNYHQTTSEDLTPGLLFQKFLDDAANAVCEELVTAEVAGESTFFMQGIPSDATRATHGAAIDQALADALLRFHGRRYAVDAPQLEEWTYLFDTTHTVTGGDSVAAWRAVCIGLIVHPDFYQY